MKLFDGFKKGKRQKVSGKKYLNQYEIININGIFEDLYGETVIVEANPLIQNTWGGIFVGMGRNKDTKYFIIPKSMVDTLIPIAQSGKYWSPNMTDFKREKIFNEDWHEIMTVFRHKHLSMSTYEDLQKKKALPVEMLASIVIDHAQSNETEKEIETLECLYDKVQETPSLLLTISDYNLVGSAFCLMGSYHIFMDNEDTRRVIADNAFYCLSQAIKKKPVKGIYLKRLSVFAYFQEELYQTIANAMEVEDDDILFPYRQHYYNMALHDFSQVRLTRYPEEKIENLYRLVKHMDEHNAQRGEICINTIIDYLTSVYQKH